MVNVSPDNGGVFIDTERLIKMSGAPDYQKWHAAFTAAFHEFSDAAKVLMDDSSRDPDLLRARSAIRTLLEIIDRGAAVPSCLDVAVEPYSTRLRASLNVLAFALRQAALHSLEGWRFVPTRKPLMEAITSYVTVSTEYATFFTTTLNLRAATLQSKPDAGGDSGADDRGVSLFDAAQYFESGDDVAATSLVRRWHDAKAINATPIGKCPSDARKQLYRLPEILADIAGLNGLDQREKAKLQRHLTARLRAPKG